jgi:hypothetical protein
MIKIGPTQEIRNEQMKEQQKSSDKKFLITFFGAKTSCQLDVLSTA